MSGGSHGIGLTIALRAARDGANIVPSCAFLATAAYFSGALFADAGFLAGSFAAVFGLLTAPEFATPLWKRRQ